ncbi:MAG: hypothetical protein ACI81P_000161 [Neolewinella sp.]|jgi:hypothetical protein
MAWLGEFGLFRLDVLKKRRRWLFLGFGMLANARAMRVPLSFTQYYFDRIEKSVCLLSATACLED